VERAVRAPAGAVEVLAALGLENLRAVLHRPQDHRGQQKRPGEMIAAGTLRGSPRSEVPDLQLYLSLTEKVSSDRNSANPAGP